jgi:predicted nicotinamide N-methyase
MIDRSPREYVCPDELPGLLRERVILKAASFIIDRPGDMEELLDLPSVQSAFNADSYMPYWADIWPAARMLARAVLETDWPSGLTALEIGCGLGLAGLAALSKGLRVIFSDYDLTAVAFAERNARLNGFNNFSTLPFDWRDPPGDLHVSLILGSDLTYEERNHEPLYELFHRLLEPGGKILLTDQDRPMTPRFIERFEQLGWPIARRPMKAGNPGQRREQGTLYTITRPNSETAAELAKKSR